MLEQPVSKLQALVLAKQLRKQINELVSKKTENWDKFGNIKDEPLALKIDSAIEAKKARLAEYRYIGLAA